MPNDRYPNLRAGPGWATAQQLDALLRLLRGGPRTAADLVTYLPGAVRSNQAAASPQDVIATASVLGLAELDDAGCWMLAGCETTGHLALRALLERVQLGSDISPGARALLDVLWEATGGDE